MQYMIHACPQRMWYVDEHLIPSMRVQGIPEDEITVWNDTEGKGNLFSCMEAFRACGERESGVRTAARGNRRATGKCCRQGPADQ